MKLSLYEQETIILYNQAEATAEVYTHDLKLLEKLRRPTAGQKKSGSQRKSNRRFPKSKMRLKISRMSAHWWIAMISTVL